MFRLDWLTLFAAFGSFQGILFSIVLWFRKKNGISNRIFSLLLLVTSIRIAKNIVVHIRELDPDLQMSLAVWRLLVNIGLTHQFAIGPLMVLYFLSKTQPRFAFSKKYLWHFTPYFLLLVTCPFQSWPFWRDFALHASYISILFYYLQAVWIYRNHLKKQAKGSPKTDSRWLRDFLIITGILLLVYSPALFKYSGYIGGAVLYAIGLYAVSAIMLQENRFTTYFQSKYPGSSVTQEKVSLLREKLELKVKVDQCFLDPELSLSKLAADLGVSTNALSQVINSTYHQSFTDFINSHRIDLAKKLLSDPEKRLEKVATIAYESGFNSLSRFNTVFKKAVGITPSVFRKQALS
ncbi:MAG: helix-turn-helix domain-containing protein [Roseivirga sp.]|nr:helix-turn-helix domain-containing protein [Roseivirga sp.]